MDVVMTADCRLARLMSDLRDPATAHPLLPSAGGAMTDLGILGDNSATMLRKPALQTTYIEIA